MKATNQRKVYLDDDLDAEVRAKCAIAGLSFSSAAARLFRHWQPNRIARMPHRNRSSYGPAMGLPGRACLRL